MKSVRGVAGAEAVAAVALLLAAGVALADTHAPWPTNWNDWTDPALWVPVGNPGNAADDTGYGAVAYTFKMGKFEVTAWQYTAFLNAVAKTDTYGLYNTNMDTAVYSYGCNIKRTDSSGNYTYSVASDWANRPVNFVSWGDAARFANWLTNGKPTGAQGLTTTENGSYYLNGAISNAALMAVERKSPEQGGRYYIPTEDEWYKATYYKGGGTNAGYWDYPTSSNTAPGRDMTDASGNNANYYSGSGAYPIDSGTYYTTYVGEFQNSDSPYGIFDQGGNVWEWNEAIVYPQYGSFRGVRGGSFDIGKGGDNVSSLFAAGPSGSGPSSGGSTNGFRVSEVPEPATLALLALGGLAILRRIKR